MKVSEKDSFYDVIIRFYPRRKLPEVIAEIGTNFELADTIEESSTNMGNARMKEIYFDAFLIVPLLLIF